MAKECIICQKTTQPGAKYKRRGMAKNKGGAGSKVVGKTFRTFEPNLQKIKINLDGTIKRADVCTSCIQAGKITKA
ncbi:MAG: 50S ribosomal protein L28 [Candidatus Omnitrophica bacterium]|nr:50S ribosomal protein L28 [Candidatus Omnitrophota bacterium]